jgi:hypothetical protein
MNFRTKLLTLTLAATLGLPALAQTSQQSQANETQRDLNQQRRIEQGLQSGQLTTREAGQLERQEHHVDQMESRGAANGNLTPAEQARIEAAQNHVSQDIAADRHNAVSGNPDSVSSRRLQADVGRDVKQEQRIHQGVKSGELTTRETGRLERQQGRTDRMEANAAANGRVGAQEQASIQGSENRHSRQIARQKHDAQTR